MEAMVIFLILLVTAMLIVNVVLWARVDALLKFSEEAGVQLELLAVIAERAP